MSVRSFVTDSDPSRVILRSPRNWTAIGFFAGLAGLHFVLSATVLAAHPWEAQVSGIFGAVFGTIALLCFAAHREFVIYLDRQRIGLVRMLGPVAWERTVAFDAVRAVRLTLINTGRYHESAVRLVCARGEIELPPSQAPRQSALALAMLLKVRLEKIYGDLAPLPQSERAKQLFGEV